MTWTFGNNPASSTLDAVRLAIGDTDTNDQLLSDETVNYALTLYPTSTLRAGAFCCRLIAANFARLVNSAADTVQLSLSQKHSQYLNMATILEDQAKKTGQDAYGMPYVGGVDPDDIQTNRQDPTRVSSLFYVGQFENPGASSDDEQSGQL